MSVTFYYTPQSSADRVHGSLQALGIPYEEVRVDLRGGDQKKPEFLKLNPNGQVPTIVIDGTPVFESVAIQIALGERFGVEKGLWPALGSSEHLTALTWLVWNQVNLTAAVFRYMQNTHDYFPKEQHNPDHAAAALSDIQRLLGVLNGHLEGKQFITGERRTLADIDLASVLGWGLMMIKLDLNTYPNVAAWLGRAGHGTDAAS
jgi:GST-like protein